MLAYAFRVLDKGTYEKIGAEEFENSLDLCAAILARGVESQLKRGLGRSYVERTERLSTLRGRVDVTATLKTSALLKRQLVCDYDELSIDTQANRILKATMHLLLINRDVAKGRKRDLRKLLPYFAEVTEIDLRSCNWKIRIDRNNQEYRLLLFICRMVYEGLLMSEAWGAHTVPSFFDDQAVSRLYEHFILEYYKKEHPELSVSASQVPWALDDGELGLLPVMQTDITLRKGDRVHIIDAKYYGHMMQQNYGLHTLHSGNLYQIFTYVKNMQEALPKDAPRVSGMLMYARTDEELLPDSSYQMSGNSISVKSLDLNTSWPNVKEQLDMVVEQVF